MNTPHQPISYRTSELGTLTERVSRSMTTITVELSPPQANNPADMRRYQSDARELEKLMNEGVIDGITIRDPPHFHPWHAWCAQQIKSLPNLRWLWLEELKLLTNEVQGRVDPQTIPAPENYIATIAAQTWDEATLRAKILNSVHKQGARVLFFPSGGDPRRPLALGIQRRFPNAFSRALAFLSPRTYSAPMSSTSLLALGRSLREEGEIPEDIQFWGVWDPLREPMLEDGRIDTRRGLATLKEKVENGLSVVWTQPPFLRKNFIDWLYFMLRDGVGERVQVKVGMPYISSSRNLRFWYRLIHINPEQNPDAGSLLESFIAAETDGRLHEYRREWNYNFMRWVLEMPFPAGIHFMPTLMTEGLSVLRELVGETSNRLTFDRRLAGQKHMTRFMRDLSRLRWPIRVSFNRVLERPDETLSGTRYVDEVEPFYEVISSAMKALQEEEQAPPAEGNTPHPFWHQLRVFVFRIKFSHSGRPPIDYRRADNGWGEIAIDIRPFSKLTLPIEEKQNRLRDALMRAVRRFRAGSATSEDVIYLDPKTASGSVRLDRETTMHVMGEEGYRAIREATGDKGPESGGLIQSAENPELVTYHVELLLQAVESTDLDEPIYLEPGIWKANGIPRFLACLQRLASSKQKNRLRRLSYVLSDFKKEAVESAHKLLGDSYAPLGIRFRYLVLDATDKPLQTYRRLGFQGRVIGGRSINLLDAVGSNLVAQYEGEPYIISARTYVAISDTKRLADKRITWEEGGENHTATYRELGITPDWLVKNLSLIHESGASNFFASIKDEHAIPRPALYQFWKDVFNILRQEHGFVHSPGLRDHRWISMEGEGEPARILHDVLRSHPGHYWMPDSGAAFSVIQGLVPLLHPEGKFLFTQLTTDVHGIYQDYESLRKMGVTLATPVSRNMVERACLASGFSIECLSMEQFGGRPTSMVFVIQQARNLRKA